MDVTAPQSFSDDIRRYAQIFLHWAWLWVLSAVLFGAITFLVSVRQPKIYKASATALIDQPQVASDYTGILSDERSALTYSQLMIQRPILEGVIEDLGLSLSVDDLGKSLTVQVIPDTQLLEISVEDTDPQRASQIVNTIGLVFAEENEELQASRYRETKNSLETQMLTMDEQIQETTRALETLKTDTGTDSHHDILQVELNTYRDIYQGLLRQIVTAETQTSMGDKGETSTVESPVEEQLEIIKGKIVEISGEIETLGYFPSGAEYELLKIELLAYQQLYQNLIQGLVFSSGSSGTDGVSIDTGTDIVTLSAQLEGTGERIQDITEEINAVGGSVNGGVERDRLESNLVLYRQAYANLVQSYEQVRLAEIQNTTRVDLVQPAIPPVQPIRPNTLQNSILGLVFGLFLGIGVVYLIEILDDTIKGPGDIHQHLGLPVLGYISHMDEEMNEPVAVQQPRSPAAEAFRSLRTNIQYASIDRPLYSIMVTSPTPQDGKSTITANLGIVLAQGQSQVVMIDADMRRPFLHKIFNLHNRKGLTDTLIHPDLLVNGNLRKTEIENLSILTTGDLPPNPSELIGSDRMVEMVRELEANSDLVLIDTPPVTAVTDPVILSTRVDGVIVVLRPGVTKLAAAIHTVEQLKQVGANLLGVVLNDVENKSNRYYHYYKGYYYNYNKYYEYASESIEDKRPNFLKTLRRDR